MFFVFKKDTITTSYNSDTKTVSEDKNKLKLGTPLSDAALKGRDFNYWRQRQNILASTEPIYLLEKIKEVSRYMEKHRIMAVRLLSNLILSQKM